MTATDSSNVVSTADQTAYQQRRLSVAQALADAADDDRTLVLHSKHEGAANDTVVAIPTTWFDDHPEQVWLPRVALTMDVSLDSDAYEAVAHTLDDNGLSAFQDDGLTSQEAKEAAEIAEEMEAVEKGDFVKWNGRSTPLPVTKHGGSWFEVTGNRGGHYRFKLGGEDERPYLTNLNSDNDYTVDEFTLVDNSTDEDDDEDEE